MDATLIQASLVFIGVGVLGALPLARAWSDRSLHVLLSVATGVFLGTLFLELLPELAVPHGSSVAPRLPWVAALAGLLGLFFLERGWVRERFGGDSPHLVVWLGTFIGLVVHALVVGLGLPSLASAEGALPAALVVPLSIHKAAESFSLATVMRMADVPLRRAWICLGLFLLATPLGLLLGSSLTSAAGAPWAELLLRGLAAGTFLHVAAYDLLPEVFHGKQQRGVRIAGLLLGLTVFALTSH